jgi:hypothetical protein
LVHARLLAGPYLDSRRIRIPALLIVDNLPVEPLRGAARPATHLVRYDAAALAAVLPRPAVPVVRPRRQHLQLVLHQPASPPAKLSMVACRMNGQWAAVAGCCNPAHQHTIASALVFAADLLAVRAHALRMSESSSRAERSTLWHTLQDRRAQCLAGCSSDQTGGAAADLTRGKNTLQPSAARSERQPWLLGFCSSASASEKRTVRATQ